MIPKVIHYCWFGGGKKPSVAKKCMASWKKYCPDYEIIEWNESNFDISLCPLYVRQAYDCKMWAFVTDYVRLKLVYDNGGIYLDTDVELIAPLDRFLDERAFFGCEHAHVNFIATGLGFGAEAGHPILKELMADYEAMPFIREDGKQSLTPCPQINTPVFTRHGFTQSNEVQQLDGGVLVLPPEYLCPYDYVAKKLTVTENTVSIHWFSATWLPKEFKKNKKKRRRRERLDRIRHLPNRACKKLLGAKRYESFKAFVKRKK